MIVEVGVFWKQEGLLGSRSGRSAPRPRVALSEQRWLWLQQQQQYSQCQARSSSNNSSSSSSHGRYSPLNSSTSLGALPTAAAPQGAAVAATATAQRDGYALQQRRLCHQLQRAGRKQLQARPCLLLPPSRSTMRHQQEDMPSHRKEAIMARWCAVPQLSGDGDISLCASDSELLPLTLLPLTLLPPPADQSSEKNSFCTCRVNMICNFELRQYAGCAVTPCSKTIFLNKYSQKVRYLLILSTENCI